MRQGFDVSDPGRAAVTGFDVAAGYLGGRTPHTWTKEQWDAQPARWRTGFWVIDPLDSPVRSAEDAVQQWQVMGAPEGTIIWLDLETTISADWVNRFADRVHLLHHCTGCYGSTSTLFRNPVRSGYFPADPTGQPHLYEHPHTIATQWGEKDVPGAALTVDLDQFTDGAPLWDTRPAPVTLRPLWAQLAIADLTEAAVQIDRARQAIQIDAK